MKKRSYVWKILRNTINKTVDRLRSSQQRRTKLLREKRDQSFNYNNNNDDENNNNNNNNNDYSIDNELLSLNQSIDEYSNDLKLLFTSIFQVIFFYYFEIKKNTLNEHNYNNYNNYNINLILY